jgi:hypothetical protein
MTIHGRRCRDDWRHALLHSALRTADYCVKRYFLPFICLPLASNTGGTSFIFLIFGFND